MKNEVSHIRSELETAEGKIGVLEEKLSAYDKLAAKWGGICLGALGLGALLSGSFDKIKEKVIGWLL